MQCGFIGLGMLGARMARQVLEAGHDLKVFDLDPAAVEKLVAKGATGAASAMEAANQVDALITCLPSPDASLKVMTGTDGVFDAMREGSCWIEMSTTDANEMIRLAGLAAERGIEVLECPATTATDPAGRRESCSTNDGRSRAEYSIRERPVLLTSGARVSRVRR